MTFTNNARAQEFVITVWREESNEVGKESNQDGNKVYIESNQVENLGTRLRHSNTDFGTRLRHSGADLDTLESDLDTRLRHSDTPKVPLSNKQRDIVNFCSVPRTTKKYLTE